MARSMIFSLLILAVIATFQINSYSQDTEATIIVEPKAMIAGSEVYLKDLAKIEVSNGLSLEEIENVHICDAAEPGFSKTLHIGYIKSRVRQQGIKIELIDWKGSDRTVIETRATRLSSQDIYSHIQKLLISQIKERYSVDEPNIHIKAVNEIRPAILPSGEANIRIEPVYSDSVSGVMPLSIIISVNSKDYEKRTILIEVKISREVITTAKDLGKNEIIQPTDLKISFIEDIKGFPDVFSQKDELIGKRLKRMVSENTIITRDMVEEIPLINKGDMVTIVIDSPAFRITAQGKSREDGIYGQSIRVENASSSKEILCQVIGEKTVKVFFPY